MAALGHLDAAGQRGPPLFRELGVGRRSDHQFDVLQLRAVDHRHLLPWGLTIAGDHAVGEILFCGWNDRFESSGAAPNGDLALLDRAIAAAVFQRGVRRDFPADCQRHFKGPAPGVVMCCAGLGELGEGPIRPRTDEPIQQRTKTGTADRFHQNQHHQTTADCRQGAEKRLCEDRTAPVIAHADEVHLFPNRSEQLRGMCALAAEFNHCREPFLQRRVYRIQPLGCAAQATVKWQLSPNPACEEKETTANGEASGYPEKRPTAGKQPVEQHREADENEQHGQQRKEQIPDLHGLATSAHRSQLAAGLFGQF